MGFNIIIQIKVTKIKANQEHTGAYSVPYCWKLSSVFLAVSSREAIRPMGARLLLSFGTYRQLLAGSQIWVVQLQVTRRRTWHMCQFTYLT